MIDKREYPYAGASLPSVANSHFLWLCGVMCSKRRLVGSSSTANDFSSCLLDSPDHEHCLSVGCLSNSKHVLLGLGTPDFRDAHGVNRFEDPANGQQNGRKTGQVEGKPVAPWARSSQVDDFGPAKGVIWGACEQAGSLPHPPSRRSPGQSVSESKQAFRVRGPVPARASSGQLGGPRCCEGLGRSR